MSKKKSSIDTKIEFTFPILKLKYFIIKQRSKFVFIHFQLAFFSSKDLGNSGSRILKGNKIIICFFGQEAKVENNFQGKVKS